MPRPYSSAVVPAPLAEVWPVLRDFNGMHRWHPAIEHSELVRGCSETEIGARRRLTLADGGGIVVEDLLALDDRNHSMTYEIIESPFPVRRYVSTVRLAPITALGHTFGEWWVDFDAVLGTDAATEDGLIDLFANGVFGAAFRALADKLG